MHKPFQVIARIPGFIHTMYQAPFSHAMAHIVDKKEHGQTHIGKFLNLLDLLCTNVLFELVIGAIGKFENFAFAKTDGVKAFANRG